MITELLVPRLGSINVNQSITYIATLTSKSTSARSKYERALRTYIENDKVHSAIQSTLS